MGQGESRRADRRAPFAVKTHSPTCAMLALLRTDDFMPFVDELTRRARLLATDPSDLEAPLVLTGSVDTAHGADYFVYLRCECAGRYVGVDVNRVDIRGQTALHAAVRRRSIDAVELLLQHGSAAYCGRRNACGMTALHTACEAGSVRVVQLLVDAGFDPDAAETGRGAAEARTPLTIAAAHGREACVAALCRAGADVDGRDGLGSAPLHRAATHGHAACLRALLDAGAAPDARDGGGATALQLTLARRRGHAGGDAVRMLLDTGCDVRAGSDALPPVLLLAAVAGEMDAVKTCLAAGVPPDVLAAGTGRSALHYVLSGDLRPLYEAYADRPPACPLKSPAGAGAVLDVGLAPPRRRQEVFACLVAHGANVHAVLARVIAADAVTVTRFVSLPHNADLLCAALAACGLCPSRLPALDLPAFLWRVIGASGDRVARALLGAVPPLDAAVRARLRDARDWTGGRSEAAELTALEDAGVGRTTAVWMRRLVTRPRPLADWCRYAARRQLGDNVAVRVDRLPLPPRLRSYLAFHCELHTQ